MNENDVACRVSIFGVSAFERSGVGSHIVSNRSSEEKTKIERGRRRRERKIIDLMDRGGEEKKFEKKKKNTFHFAFSSVPL